MALTAALSRGFSDIARRMRRLRGTELLRSTPHPISNDTGRLYKNGTKDPPSPQLPQFGRFRPIFRGGPCQGASPKSERCRCEILALPHAKDRMRYRSVGWCGEKR